jgi:predicted MFS family arabinose efflux permease
VAERRQGAGPVTLALTSAGVTGIVTSMTMLGPLLVDISRALGVPLGRAGLLAAAASTTMALSSPFAGLLSDRLGRRPMIVFSLAAMGLLQVAAALTPSFVALVIVRVCAGLVGSLAPTSLLAGIGDLFSAERRARAMGWFNLGFSFAALGGVPLMGVIGGVFGWRWAFATNGVMLLALAAGVRLWYPATPPLAAGTSVLATYRVVWGVRGLLPLLGANLMERSLFMMVTLYLPAYLMLSYGMSAAGVAPVLAVVALGAIGGNVVGGWLGDRFLRPAIFIGAQLVAGLLGLALFGSSPRLGTAVALACLLTLANASSRPGFLAYGSELAPAQRGALLGLLALSNQSGVVLGATVGAAVIGTGSYIGLAVIALAQGALAAVLALPLLRRGPSARRSTGPPVPDGARG